jgi:hypothetical protein
MTASGGPMSLPISLSLDENVSCLMSYEIRAWATAYPIAVGRLRAGTESGPQLIDGETSRVWSRVSEVFGFQDTAPMTSRYFGVYLTPTEVN